MYVLIRDFYANLLIENIDEKFQKDNKQLIKTINFILKDQNHVLYRFIDNEIKKELKVLKMELKLLKLHNAHQNTLLNDIYQHMMN